MKVRDGVFNLDARTVIDASPEAKDQANALATMLASATGFRLKTRSLGEAQKNAIVLRLNPVLTEMGDEWYTLDVTADRVVIEAFKPAGIFYGIQTLRQLLPLELDSPKPVMNVTWSVPCVEMRDQPRFPWRGFMLDSCRHFQSVATIKQVVDLMARYKLNRLHWHLTEDEAWRVEVPGYPKLTDIGAWRAETNSPHYGGFYTAKEIREVTDYAKERFVMVYPEIEMPGHATAALAAHPEFTCKGQAATRGAPGLRYFYATSEDRKAFCPSRPETFTFLENVVGKVATMFDSPYIHIGADEVPRKQWSDCPRCQAFIGQQQLKDVVGLQGYFSQRMASTVKSLNKEAIYWGVDLDRFIPTNIIVQAWHPGECLMAIRRGFRTINSDCNNTYLDYSSGPGDTGTGILPKLALDRVYAFEPVPIEATLDEARLVLGGEAPLWTELVPEDKVTTKMFPRLFAFAEVLWSPRRPRDIADLRARIAPQLARFDLMKVPYYVETPETSPVLKTQTLEKSAPPQIGLSHAMPLVGQAVRLSVQGGADKICRIIGPKGAEKEVKLDSIGQASWVPERYGKHVILCGNKSEVAWVLASPMSFHWWDERNNPRRATVVMTSRPEYWRSRGVKTVRWAVGEYAARTNGEYSAHLRSTPEDWFKDWFKISRDCDGIAVDEMYCGPNPVNLALSGAVALLRKSAGADCVISVYSGGAEKGFDAGAKLLLENKALCMIESYYGDDKAFLSRWNAMKKYGLEKNTIFAIGPGFKLRPDCHGPLTEAEVKEEFAKVRRVAPESPGIALYNAFSLVDRARIQPDLDAACSQAIEDYFLKPVISAAMVQEGNEKRLEASNIGNEDAEGFQVQWLDDAGKSLGSEIPLPTLTPQTKSSLAIPANAKFLKLKNPIGTVNIYSNGVISLP
jgi:N-acetyl-beta-hexosaminidase